MKTNKYFVYMHIAPNGKRYIGITQYSNVKRRWQNGLGYSHNDYFNRAIKKYGWENFEHIVLYENVEKEFAMLKEQELIKKYDTTNKEKGFNISMGGEFGSLGIKNPHSEEWRRNQSEKLKGHYSSEETNKKISKALKGKKKSKEHCENISKSLKGNIPWNKGVKRTDEERKNIGLGHKDSKAVNQYDLNGTLINTFYSQGEAHRQTNIQLASINRCCLGKQNSAGGFIWKYKEQ